MPTGPTAESPKTNDFTQPLGPSRQPPIFSAQIRGTACMIISSCLVASPIMNPNTCYLQILAQRLQIPAKITKDCMGLSGKGNDQLGHVGSIRRTSPKYFTRHAKPLRPTLVSCLSSRGVASGQNLII